MRILVVLTAKATLHLLDGEQHPSGFWAEEFVVPYTLFQAAGHTVDVATIGGATPTVDQTSIDPQFLQYVRPAGSPDEDAANAAEYVRVIEQAPQLRSPLAIESLGEKDVAGYDALYILSLIHITCRSPTNWHRCCAGPSPRTSRSPRSATATPPSSPCATERAAGPSRDTG